MRVTVDHGVCEANGVRASLVPQAFHLDDEDYPHLTAGEVPPELADLVRRAVLACPKTALSLAE